MMVKTEHKNRQKDLLLKRIRCAKCGAGHEQQLSNCCWINCECGEQICGACGSTNIIAIDEDTLDLSDGADDNYWCCKQCGDCGQQGCGMCV